MFNKYWILLKISNGRRWLADTLQWLSSGLRRADNDLEHQKRIAQVREFLNYDLPILLEIPEPLSIIEGGRFNYFQLPSGQLPRFDFVIPQLALYLYVPNVAASEWSEARDRGVPRECWEDMQLNLDFMEESMQRLEFQGEVQMPVRYVCIQWDQPVNKLALTKIMREVFKK